MSIKNDQPRNKKMKFDEHENGTVLSATSPHW